MQLRRALAAALAVLVWAPASLAVADGSLAMRGAYYKERSTRVVQPMLDAKFEVDPDTDLELHTLVDAITSASVAAGAADEPFTERRYEGGVAVTRRIGELSIGGFGRYSYEPDYQSLFGGLRAQHEFAQKNTAVGVSVAAGTDAVSNAGATGGLGPAPGDDIRGNLATVLASASLTQVLSPVLVAGFTYDIIYLSGFQENAYRQVIAAGMLERERVPDTRVRHALFGNVRGFVPATATALVAGYRIYADDWGVRAHTPELRVIQELRRELDVHLRYRYHRQGAAEFFKPIYDSTDPAVEPFITDDVKLSAFSTHTLGIKVESALEHLGVRDGLERWRADIVIEYIVQNNRFGNAVAGQFALTIPFDY